MRAVWRRRLGQGERGVDDVGGAGLGGDRAGVADLAAALGVERGLVEEDLDRLAGARRRRDGGSTATSSDVEHGDALSVT